jgi:serine kinase of HPr protein (carbohydrate metabolism regulator)
MSVERNYHASVIVIGTQGFLITGPSGSGKTSLALNIMAQAEARGVNAAMVGDDQVLISRHGSAVIAKSIASIAGKAEIRGADIVRVAEIAAVVIDFAVQPFTDPTNERLAPENETLEIDGVGTIPLLRLPAETAEPFDRLMRLASDRL